MIKVLLCGKRLDEHVVDVHFYGLTKMVGEHLVNESLVRGTSILEPQGVDFVAEDAPLRDKGSLLLIFRVHKYLVKA